MVFYFQNIQVHPIIRKSLSVCGQIELEDLCHLIYFYCTIRQCLCSLLYKSINAYKRRKTYGPQFILLPHSTFSPVNERHLSPIYLPSINSTLLWRNSSFYHFKNRENNFIIFLYRRLDHFIYLIIRFYMIFYPHTKLKFLIILINHSIYFV